MLQPCHSDLSTYYILQRSTNSHKGIRCNSFPKLDTKTSENDTGVFSNIDDKSDDFEAHDGDSNSSEEERSNSREELVVFTPPTLPQLLLPFENDERDEENNFSENNPVQLSQ